ncbi:hypothetical protein PLANPX_1132 [Lacipirellula parvula]|uniref:Uncharacterized protein n=1 Tax=Lacipirellula parvula TaxID=2650471 RepID=A0A5K7X4Q1_9BACT|nr:hypothetical protein PLANPX_1132 [Lacipirellula parvula]
MARSVGTGKGGWIAFRCGRRLRRRICSQPQTAVIFGIASGSETPPTLLGQSPAIEVFAGGGAILADWPKNPTMGVRTPPLRPA